MLTPIPLSRFEGVLRQIAVEKLSSVEREVFQHVFPTFDETPTFSEPARVNMAHGRNVQTPYNYRRFAGGPELPRGCYSSVCNSEGTGDDGTLIHELLFYAKPDTTGEIYLLEGTDERLLGGEQSSLGRFSGYRPDPSSLVVAFVSRPGRLHPLLDPDAAPLDDRRAMREFRRTAPRSDQGVAILELPTTSRQVSLTSIFDLRRLSSQAWLNERAR